MPISIRIAAFAVAAGSATTVTPAQQSHLAVAAAPMSASSAASFHAGLPQVAMPSVDALLDETDMLSGELAIPETIPPADPVAEIEAAPVDIAPAGDDLASLVQAHADTRTRNEEMECLARAIYFETRGEPLHGQLAVGEVIVNRAESSRFPDSYCGVVKQRRQFSFVRGGRIPEPRRTSKAWRTAVAIARITDRDLHDTKMDGSLFFHANYVNPRWRLTRVGSLGNHIFYR